jgi:XTP/dITP diphosphohydrolase
VSTSTVTPEPVTPALLLVTTGRHCAAGLLTWPAWQALRSAGTVLARHDLPAAWAAALAEAGVAVALQPVAAPEELARDLAAAAARGRVAWLGSADGDPGLGSALTRLMVQASSSGRTPVAVEVVPGSWDVPGAAVGDLVAVMDRLRSPGGCPWDAEQTHASLVPYALEEAYEVAEAVETGDREGLREELGDLLLQVVFHARVAAEHPAAPFDVDDVALGIATKLRRRHPHVFADATAATASDVETAWEALKQQEKGRASVLDGVPVAMPALARAQKVLGRVDRSALAGAPAPAAPGDGTTADLGTRLLALVQRARTDGVDAEAALRRAVRDVEARARAAESQRSTPAPEV